MTKRILVIEDTEDNRQIIRDLLTSAGYELVEAVDAIVQAQAAADAVYFAATCGRRLDGSEQDAVQPEFDPCSAVAWRPIVHPRDMF